jgi:hypothetical protein
VKGPLPGKFHEVLKEGPEAAYFTGDKNIKSPGNLPGKFGAQGGLVFPPHKKVHRRGIRYSSHDKQGFTDTPAAGYHRHPGVIRKG